MQSLSSVMVFGMNKILITFTETAVNVFGVYYKLQSFVFMPMHAMGEPAFRIIALSFLPAAVGIVMSSVFQALGEGLISLVMSATRQLVFLLPLAFLLAKFSGLAAVWASIPLAEVVGFALALLFYRHIYNHKIAHIETVQFG